MCLYVLNAILIATVLMVLITFSTGLIVILPTLLEIGLVVLLVRWIFKRWSS